MDFHAARAHLALVDPVLHAALAEVGDPTDTPPRPLYEALLRSVVGQQLSVKAAATIWGRVEEAFGGPPTPAQLLSSSPEALRSLGVSLRKAGYLQGIARAFSTDEFEEEALRSLSPEAFTATITGLKGVGPWTAQMLLMSCIRHPDIFAVGDLGLRNAMKRIYGLSSSGKTLERECEALAAPWSPHRTAVSRLLWRFLDNEPKT